jgi:hypothetical protein
MLRSGRTTAELGRVAKALILMVSAAVVVAGTGMALADESHPGFRVVSHLDNATGPVERQFLADAFLKKATTWPDGQIILPIDLRYGTAVRHRFSEQVLRRSAAAIRSYWQQRIFTGRGVPPPELESDAAVLRYVQSHRGAVGYVSESAETSAVKVITVY